MEGRHFKLIGYISSASAVIDNIKRIWAKDEKDAQNNELHKPVLPIRYPEVGWNYDTKGISYNGG